MPIDPTEFRRVMATFATGVTVITMPTRNGAWGMTANSITSLSLDPTLVLICVDKSTRTHEHILASEVWAVNVLSTSQEAVSRAFALKDLEEERTMVGTPYHYGITGAPLIDGCVSYIECRTWATYEGGDHTIVVGEVAGAGVPNPDSPPLVFFKARYVRLAEQTG